MGIRRSEQAVRSKFLLDGDGNPSGGSTYMEVYGDVAVLNVLWQDGPVENGEQNGAFVEDVIEAALQRLRFFNSSPKWRCRENSLAITKLEEALMWLDWRTRLRVAQGVENTYHPHSVEP